VYDDVLSVGLPEGTQIVGFADDVVLTATGCNPRQAAEEARRAISVVQRWMEEHSLSLALEKTEMVMVSSMRLGHPRIPVRVVDRTLWSQRSLCYLGVQIEDHLSWNPHVRHITNKAATVLGALQFMLRNHGGPSSTRRRILASVATSIMRYASPVWWKATKLKCNRRLLNRVHRQAAKGVASAFRTVKYECVILVAGMPPIIGLIEEDYRCHERKRTTGGTSKDIRKEERAETFRRWQRSWDDSANRTGASRFVRWTHRVLPEVEPWVNRKHGLVNFHMSQILTGHGFFREYLWLKKFTQTPDCTQCPGVVESVNHAFFECPGFSDVRERLLGPVTADTLQEHLLHSQDRWNQIQVVAKTITTELQTRWRRANVDSDHF
uniref:Reverse transcriptase domain-containing protein n=1 Tax=Anopheles atroparvus TaxID=41427 RepID=A0AAG5DFF7_ANOAO